MKSKILRAIKYNVYSFPIYIFFILLLSPFAALSETSSSEIKKIAIIPFEINSQKDISYIKDGILQMLSSRLAWKNNTLVATAADKSGNIENADYVIRGSITEFSEAFSVDATVYNVRQNGSQSFFAQADNPEKIIPSVEMLSAKINKEIFNRETASLWLIDAEKSQASLNSIRANPEKLMPLSSFDQGAQQKSRPFWKFWGKEDTTSLAKSESSMASSSTPKSSSGNILPEEKVVIHTEIEDDDEELQETKKPFWKIW